MGMGVGERRREGERDGSAQVKGRATAKTNGSRGSLSNLWYKPFSVFNGNRSGGYIHITATNRNLHLPKSPFSAPRSLPACPARGKMRAESWDDDEDSDNAPLLPVHAASEADSSATATSSWEYTYLNIQGKIYRSRWPIFCIFVVWSFCLLAALNDAVDDLTWQSWFVIALVWGGL
eukprot:3671527-Rhodomonas_salina.4